MPSFSITLLAILPAILSTTFIYIMLHSYIIYLFRDKPGTRKIHQSAIPRAGGVCLVILFIPLLLIINKYSGHIFEPLESQLFNALMFSSICILAVGFFDDSIVFHIENKAKFILEFIIALEVVFIFNIKFETLSLFGYAFELGNLSIPISIFWIVGVSNALNIIDGVDGLAGSVSLSTFISIGILGLAGGAPGLTYLSILLVALIAGFLVHNSQPASIFLGDTGSLFLGITLGTLTIYITTLPALNNSLLVPGLLVGLPVLDVFVAMGRRYFKAVSKGTKWFKAFSKMTVADNEHIHHRLIFRGLTHSKTTLVLVLFSSTLSFSACIIAFCDKIYFEYFIVGYLSILTILFLYRLDFFEILTRNSYFSSNKKEVEFVNVAVIGSSHILTHSLKAYKQDVIKFVFTNANDIMNLNHNLGAVIIDNNSDDNFEDDVQLAVRLANQNSIPVIIALDDPLFFKETHTRMMHMLVHYVRKPVYIPNLLDELNTALKFKFSLESNSDTLKGTTNIRIISKENFNHEEA